MMDGSKGMKKNGFICGASVAGPAHTVRNIPNQDSFAWMKRKKFSVFVVSDGLGSKRLSHLGSQKVCDAVLSQVQQLARDRHLSNTFFSEKHYHIIVNSFLQGIIQKWEALLLPNKPKECSATCLFVVVTPKKIFTARIGDGMICLLGKKKEIVLSDKNENVFSNMTSCLSDSMAIQKFQYNFFDRKDFFCAVLSTDGISSDLEQNQELPFSKDLLHELQQLVPCKRNEYLLNMMKNWPVPHHTDDKTLILARWHIQGNI